MVCIRLNVMWCAKSLVVSSCSLKKLTNKSWWEHIVNPDSVLTGYHWFKDIPHTGKRKYSWKLFSAEGTGGSHQLWTFKWEGKLTSASVTTLFLNKRSRSSSLEHLTTALRANTTTVKLLFLLCSYLCSTNREQNSWDLVANWVVHFQIFQKRTLVLNNSFLLLYASYIMAFPKTAET